RKPDGTLGNFHPFQLLSEVLQQRTAAWEETAVLGKRRVAYQETVVTKRRDAIADSLGRLRRNSRTNHGADLLESGTGWFGDRSQVGVDIACARCSRFGCDLLAL